MYRLSTENPSELLPDNWNTSNKPYCNHYRIFDNDYILQGVITSEVLTLRFVCRKTQKMCYVNFDVEYIIDENINSGGVIKVHNFSVLYSRLKNELLDPIINQIYKQDISTQTSDYRSLKLLRNEYPKNYTKENLYPQNNLHCVNMDRLFVVPEKMMYAERGMRKLYDKSFLK